MFGSFLNVVVYRVPRKQSVVRPRSRCPHCGTELTALDNVPVLSWLLLRGRCRHCGSAISPRYLAGEIATAALWTLAVLRLEWWAALLFGALFWVLLALSLIDLEHKLLPNRIVYPATVVGMVAFAAAAIGLGHPVWFAEGLVGGAAAFAFFFVVALIAPAGMGMGDVKLSFLIGLALGFWAGWRAVVVGLFLGFLSGAVTGIALMLAGKAGRKTAVPFGPFMALGCVVTILWTDAVIRLLPSA